MNIASYIFLLILTSARVWLAVPLFLTARKNNLSNLYWLSASFAVTAYYLFSPAIVSPISNPWIFHLGFMVGHFCLSIFIHKTFYRDRKSPVVFFAGLTILGFTVNLYGLSGNDLNLVGMMTAVGVVNWTWHLVVARSAYAQIASDASVEKWVKARYRLMILYTVMMMVSGIQLIISSTNLSQYVPQAILPFFLIMTIVAIVLQFLVWAMPEPFRRWLNRENRSATSPVPTKPPQQSILEVFGNAMTTGTGLQSIACLYAIRATISKNIGSTDSLIVQDHLNSMTYHEWNNLLHNPELRRILINGGADVSSSAQAIENANRALVEKQSLLTLRSHY